MTDLRPSILVVDDVPDNIAIIANALKDLYRVRAATSGARALQICQGDEPPALILLDVVMPELDGFEVCRQLKADPATAEIPVIFVTGLSESSDEEHGFAAGGVDFIIKPVSLPLVRQRVGVHLEHTASRRRLRELNERFSRYLSPELSRSLATGKVSASVGTHRRKLTVFFSDIVGFTRQTEMIAPEDMTFLLNSYFAAMADIVAEHGGTFDKYIGDALMVFFGDPETRGPDEDAASCVSMALAMQRAVTRLAPMWLDRGIHEPLRIRIGIATGYCAVGSFGSPYKLEYTAMGRPVNLAARLQSHADPGGVLVSEPTYALVRDRFPLVAAPAMSLKGLPDGVGAYKVVVETGDEVLVHNEPGASVRIDPTGLSPESRRALAEAMGRLADRLRAGSGAG